MTGRDWSEITTAEMMVILHEHARVAVGDPHIGPNRIKLHGDTIEQLNKQFATEFLGAWPSAIDTVFGIPLYRDDTLQPGSVRAEYVMWNMAGTADEWFEYLEWLQIDGVRMCVAGGVECLRPHGHDGAHVRPARVDA